MAPFANFIGGESEGGEHGKSGGEELVAAIQNLCDLLPDGKSSQMPICGVVGP